MSFVIVQGDSYATKTYYSLDRSLMAGGGIRGAMSGDAELAMRFARHSDALNFRNNFLPPNETYKIEEQHDEKKASHS